jgi:hypothetical protein
MPSAKTEGGGGGADSVSYTEGKAKRFGRKSKDGERVHKGSKEWIIQKKERRRRQASENIVFRFLMNSLRERRAILIRKVNF